MRTLLILLLLASFASSAQDYPACDIKKSKQISFRNHGSIDYLQISVSGAPCYKATLKITLTTQQGNLIYSYESDYKRHTALHWAEKDFDRAALRHVNHMLSEAITSSTNLPESKHVCFKGQSVCDYDQNSDFTAEQYNRIKASGVPMLNHSTYYEGWSSYIFDMQSNKTIQVLDGGL